MKTLLLLLTLSLFACSYGQTYTYHNYPDTNVTWYAYRHICIGNGGVNHFINFIQGDTIINGYTYHIVTGTPYKAIPGYVRKDSTGTLYAIHKTYGAPTPWEEKSFAKFTLDEGDSLVIDSDYVFHVTKVDTPIYDGISRKTLYVTLGSSTFSDVWIDGIGSIHSPIGIHGYIPIYAFNCNYTPCKLSNENYAFYENSNGFHCSYFNSVDEVAVKGLAIYPNPTSHLVNVVMPNNFKANTIKVYSSVGVLEMEHITQNASPQSTIDVSALPPGLYFLHIADAEGISYVQKFIKEN